MATAAPPLEMTSKESGYSTVKVEATTLVNGFTAAADPTFPLSSFFTLFINLSTIRYSGTIVASIKDNGIYGFANGGGGCILFGCCG